jgi:hypothetical protein
MQEIKAVVRALLRDAVTRPRWLTVALPAALDAILAFLRTRAPRGGNMFLDNVEYVSDRRR